MTENKSGPARVVDDKSADYDTIQNKPGPAGTAEPSGYDLAENKSGPAKVVEEPTGYDHPPTDRIPVPGDLSADRSNAERDRTDPDRLDDQVEDPRPTPVEAADIAEPARPSAPDAAPLTGATRSPAAVGLFEEGDVSRFRDRWRELQSGFVDDPAQAVRGADELVDEIMRELAERRQNIEEQWRDGAGDTEELRVAIQEYRAFFNQLLNA